MEQQHIINEKKLEKIDEWIYSSHAYLSQSSDYARGYKDGITRAKEIVKEITENNSPAILESVSLLQKIAKATRSRFEEMPHFQRPELSKEELLELAEEMRKSLEEIYELTILD